MSELVCVFEEAEKHVTYTRIDRLNAFECDQYFGKRKKDALVSVKRRDAKNRNGKDLWRTSNGSIDYDMPIDELKALSHSWIDYVCIAKNDTPLTGINVGPTKDTHSNDGNLARFPKMQTFESIFYRSRSFVGKMEFFSFSVASITKWTSSRTFLFLVCVEFFLMSMMCKCFLQSHEADSVGSIIKSFDSFVKEIGFIYEMIILIR